MWSSSFPGNLPIRVNSYRQILENSSIFFSVFLVFRVMSQTVLLENSTMRISFYIWMSFPVIRSCWWTGNLKFLDKFSRICQYRFSAIKSRLILLAPFRSFFRVSRIFWFLLKQIWKSVFGKLIQTFSRNYSFQIIQFRNFTACIMLLKSLIDDWMSFPVIRSKIVFPFPLTISGPWARPYYWKTYPIVN